MGDFPSGQRGQTVNLLSLTSVVRIFEGYENLIIHSALLPNSVFSFSIAQPSCFFKKNLKSCLKRGKRSRIEGIAYHQQAVLYRIKPQANARWRVMRYSPDGADDMHRTLCGDDMPSLRLG